MLGTTSRSAAIVALTVLAVAAAGCGGGSSSGSSTIPTGGANGAAPASGKAQGGTARFNLTTDTDYVDPALAYYTVSWQFEYATCAQLLNYPDRAGAGGSQLVPEVAAGLPRVSADGKTYTFTVRKGFRFSPPSNAPVTAQTFKYTIDRVLNLKMQSPGAQFIGDVVGAAAVQNGTATSASGVVAHGDTLTIHLTKKAPDFASRIAMPFFCPVPIGTPIDSNGVQQVAGAGPYYVSSWTPKRQLVLKRNPNYTGTRPHNLDRIVYTIGVPLEATSLEVQKGSADYAADGVAPSVHSQLGPKYGPGSPAAKAGHQQYFVNPILSFRYLALNTSRGMFKGNEKLRQAVNYAIDRRGLLLQRGLYAGTPTSHYLPPGIAGSPSKQPYPLAAPDLKKAQQLAGAGKHGTAVMYTCNESPCPETAQIVQANLARIGINVDVKTFARAVQIDKEGLKGEPMDIAFEGWQADYADPYDFINVLLDGRSIQNAHNVNYAYFNDPSFNKQMQQAAGLAGPQRSKAYGALDLALASGPSPLAAWGNDNERAFFSARIGCQLFQPVYGMDISAMCLRK
jgi:peptide/nickel transport system substrate-binding protein